MFQFNFNSPSTAPDLGNTVSGTVHLSKELSQCRKALHNRRPTFVAEEVKLGNQTLLSVSTNCALSHVNSDEEKDLTIVRAETDHSDLTSGSYEGGLKIWECTFDLAQFISLDLFKDKSVLDLGCGSGLLGLLAYKLKAKQVHFQDYNEGVLKHFTIPNVFLNDEINLKNSRFWSGDWDSFNEVNTLKYDIILSSETIYNCENYRKLHNVFENKLKRDGTIYLAGKSYYFGVGGSMKQFKDLVTNLNIFSCIKVWSNTTGVKREIYELKFK